MCIKEGKSCHLARSDMRSAFRQLGMLIRCWPYLILKATSPLDNKVYYFVDKCLPFGSAISCAHFQRFSNAIAYLVKCKTGKPLVNYLDDYLFIQFIKSLCNDQVKVFLNICEQINFPVSMEKTFWGTQLLTFLGLLIDTVNQTVSLPIEKIYKAQLLIKSILGKKKVTLLKLQQICGFLNFLCRCIVPGRAFMRRLYAVTAGKDHLKPHHHLRVSSEMKADLLMWSQFIQQPQIYCRPFLDFSKDVQADQLDFTTNASGKIGFGAVLGTKFMHGLWDKVFLEDKQPSIEYLELYALVAACLAWTHNYPNCRIIMFCDNQSVVAMVNNSTSTCRQCMVLIRILTLHCLKINTRIFVKYIDTKSNFKADMLSRGLVNKYKLLYPHDDQPTMVPSVLYPINKLWLK